MGVGFVPFLQIDIAVLILLLVLDLTFPGLIGLFSVLPISSTPGVICGLLSGHRHLQKRKPPIRIAVPNSERIAELGFSQLWKIQVRRRTNLG